MATYPFFTLILFLKVLSIAKSTIVDPSLLNDYGWTQVKEWTLARQGQVAESLRNSSLLLMYGGREQVSTGLSTSALQVTDDNVYYFRLSSQNESGIFPMISFNTDPGARFMAASFLWGTGESFFVVGGYQSDYLIDVWRADAKPFESNSYGQWRPVHDAGSVSTPDGRYGHIAELIQYEVVSGVEMGYAIVFGGISSGGYVLSDAWVLQLQTTGTVPDCNATKIFNGTSCSDYVSTLEDHEKLWWELPLSNSSTMPAERAFATAISLGHRTYADNSSCLYMMGGYDYVSSTYYSELWRLCSDGKIQGKSTNFTWTLLSPKSAGTPPQARYGHAVASSTPGRFFVFGGSSRYPMSYQSDSFEYDAKLNVWMEVNLKGDIAARRSHKIAVVNDSIVAVGGMDATGTLPLLNVANYSAPLCEGGFYLTLTGSNAPVCRNCSAGYYSTYGSYKCTECPVGTYNPDGASSNCTNCPIGSYNPFTASANASSCLPCDAGESTLQVASSSQSDCVGCNPGYYKSISGAGSCLECAAGSYSLGSATTCASCDVGEYSLAGWSNCTQCPAGTFQPNTSAAFCTICPKGYYSNQGAGSCTGCPMGTYNPDTRGSSLSACLDCPRGYYCPYMGGHTPYECTAGTASNSSRAISATNCTDCAPGSYSDTAGSPTCATCAPGTYQALWGQTSCDLCPENTYLETTGATNLTDCQYCPSGTTSSTGTGSKDDCSTCSPGTYANSPDEGPGCSECQRGRYTGTDEEAALYNCTLCAPNTYNNVTGQSSCQECPNGYYSFSGYTKCVPCNGTCPIGPNGHLCSNTGTCSEVYSTCECEDGWGYLDCSWGYGDGRHGVVGFALDSQGYSNYESGSFVLSLVRRIGLNGTITAVVDVAGGTATPGLDYKSSLFPMNVTFADGQDEVFFSIPMIDDSETDEPCEYLNLTILPTSDVASVSYRGLEDLSPNATIYVMEDDFTSEETNTTSYDTSNTGGISPHTATVLLGADNYTMTLVVTSPTDPSTSTSLDLLFLVDISEGNKKYVKKLRDNIDNNLLLVESSYEDIYFGIASFTDKPMSPYGDADDDVEFQINLALTASTSDFSTAMSNLVDACLDSNSGDAEGSQLTALLQVAKQSSAIGWRTHAYRVVVLVTETDFHTPDDGCISDGYCTDGSNNLDSDVSTTEDYPSVANVASALMSAGIIPIFVTLQDYKDNYKAIGQKMNDCYQWTKILNSVSLYTKIKSALSDLENYICAFVTDDDEGYALSLSAASGYKNVEAGNSITYSLQFSSRASTADSTVDVFYWGFTTTITIERSTEGCLGTAVEASGGMLFASEDEARNGILQGFHSDEELDWELTGSGSFSIESVKGPFGITVEALNMTPCAGEVCSTMVAAYSFEPTYQNNIPLVLKAHSLASAGAESHSIYNYSVYMDITLQDGSGIFPAISLFFNSSKKTWQYQFDVFYPNDMYVVQASVYVSYTGSGSVIWSGIGLYGRSVEGCLCDDGYYVNALTTAGRLCRPKPSCRYEKGVSACTRCTTGYYCKAGRLEPCRGTDWAPGGSDQCYSCRDGWLCKNGLTTPCERVNNRVSNGTEYCVTCPSGHWCRNGVPYACPKGKFSIGGPNADQCVACAPGTVANETGLSQCYSCPPGTTSNHAVSGCVPCPPGEYSASAGQFPCQSCAPGTYSPGGSEECQLCPFGTYNEEYASSQCFSCPQGTNTTSTGTNSSSLCK